MKQLYPTNFTFTFRLLPLYRNTSLFLLIFLLNFTLGFGQNPENTPPEYEWNDDESLPSVSLSNPRVEDITVAADTDPSGNIYTLTFGNGVKKRNPDGGSPQNFISGNQFESPLDLAIDSQGNIYVADYFAQDDGEDNGKVKVYNAEGNYLRTIFTDFYRPVGLAIDNEDNIYVAEYNDAKQGPEQDQVLSRLSIYDSVGGLIDRTDENLEAPYRLAVDSNQRVFVSQAGDDNPRVLIFNSNLDYQGVMPGIDSPGSIIIDKFDFIHVVEYSGRVNFNEFLTISNFSDAIAIAEDIYDGIQEGDFFIRVFSPSFNEETLVKNYLEFPIDIAFNQCATMVVLNSNVQATKPFGIFFPTSLDFSLELFNRTPSLDTENPTALCKSGLEFTLVGDEVTLTVEDIDDGSTDNCEIAEIDISPSVFTETGEQEVTLTVTDTNGNVDACTTQITILPPEEEEPSVTCPGNSVLDELELGENCNYILPDIAQYIETENFENEEFSVVDENINNNILTVEVEVLDGEEIIETCELQFELIDETPPLITCPKDFTREIPAGEDSIEINYDLPEVSDNCSENLTPVLIDGPESGSEFEEGTYTIEFQVTDDAGLMNTCSFTITITQEEAQPSVTCPDNEDLSDLSLDQNCEYELPTNWSDIIETENFDDLDFSISESRVDNILNVEVEVLDGSEIIETCELQFELIDEIEPEIICPENITREIPAGEDSVEINYDLPEVSDNCSENLTSQLIAGPESGSEFEEGTYTIEFQVTDDAGLITSCDFTIIVTQADPAAPEIECINQEIFLDEDGQAILDVNKVYNGERDDLELSLSQENFDCSNLGANTVTLTATDPVTGLSSTCSAGVEVIDPISPEANCVAPGREFRLQNGSVTISPSAIDLNSEDNCEITRTLSEDTFTTPGTKNIILYVEDSAGNTDQCSTSIEILAEDDQSPQPNYECFEGNIPDLRLDEDCEVAVIPDYSYLVETENFTPRFEQTEERFGETLVVTLEVINAENNNLVGECTFSISIVDLLPPSISCPGDQTENFDPETGFEVPNYESWATFSDNCGEVSFRQEPEAGAIIFQDTTVQLFAEDANEQVNSCSFELQLTEANVLNIFCQIDQNVSPDEDCSFTLPDYTDTAEVSLPGATVTQSPPEGTVINENTQVKLTATLNGETDECFFMVNLVDNENPVANCVSGYVVNLDESGNATLVPEMLDNNSTDNCGIVSMALSQINFTRADIGEVPITLTVRDDAGNMDTCETTVEVVDEASGEFECRENVVVNLNENGEAVLSLQELYTGNASGLTLEASRLNFSCSDLGMVQIQLDYSGAQTGSCTINVEVRDEIPPFINTDIVELTLDDEGFAYLEEGDVLAENNCGQQFIYRFSKSVFNCEDVGLNTVNVEVEDANGNIAEKNIEVRVNGEACEIPDNEDLEFLFIYPNPNNGTFTIATPEGMQVEQVRVFDSRGRFILQKEYKDIARFYRMTIEGVESSVYTLQIFTNEGVVVKRVIISQ